MLDNVKHYHRHQTGSQVFVIDWRYYECLRHDSDIDSHANKF